VIVIVITRRPSGRFRTAGPGKANRRDESRPLASLPPIGVSWVLIVGRVWTIVGTRKTLPFTFSTKIIVCRCGTYGMYGGVVQLAMSLTDFKSSFKSFAHFRVLLPRIR